MLTFQVYTPSNTGCIKQHFGRTYSIFMAEVSRPANRSYIGKVKWLAQGKGELTTHKKREFSLRK